MQRVKVIGFCCFLMPMMGWVYGQDGVEMERLLCCAVVYQLVRLGQEFGVWHFLRKLDEELMPPE